MREDQVRDLLRTLDDDRVPDPAFAGALYDRLAAEARPGGSSPATVLLLAAALVVALAAGLAIGSGLVRLPVVVESPSATPLAAESTPTPEATDSSRAPTASPSPEVESPLIGRIIAVRAAAAPLRAGPTPDADEVRVLRAGQRMGVVGGPVLAGGMEWYEVRIGPGDLSGWVAAGADRGDLALVEDGAIAAACGVDDCPEGPGVYVADPEEGRLEKVADDPMWVGVWSPDGTRLAVSDAGPSSPGMFALLDAEGNVVSEARPVHDVPSWSPDGSRLAWSTGDALMVAGVDRDPVELLRMDATLRPPAWSPDGTRLAFVQRPCPECDAAGRLRPAGTIWVVDADGTDLRPLGAAATDFVQWTPDGRHLAFSPQDGVSARSDLSLLRVDDGTLVASIAEDLVPGWAFWSPDGASLVYTTLDGLVVAAGDGSDPRVLLELPSITIPQVRWAPGGDQLLVEIIDAEGSSVRIVDSATGQVRDVLPGAPYFSVLQWQPVLIPLP